MPMLKTARSEWTALFASSALLLIAAVFILGKSHPQQKHPSTAKTITYSTDSPSETKPSSSYNWQGSTNDPKLLTIPSIGVKAYIQNVGVDQKKEVAVPNNLFMAGWFVNSVRPGDRGLSIIDGHVHGVSKPGVFIDLNKLKVGDTFNVTFGNGNKKDFEVTKLVSLNTDDAGSTLFSQDPNIAHQLSLVTCTGKYDQTIKQYTQRLIVVSKLVVKQNS